MQQEEQSIVLNYLPPWKRSLYFPGRWSVYTELTPSDILLRNGGKRSYTSKTCNKPTTEVSDRCHRTTDKPQDILTSGVYLLSSLRPHQNECHALPGERWGSGVRKQPLWVMKRSVHCITTNRFGQCAFHFWNVSSSTSRHEWYNMLWTLEEGEFDFSWTYVTSL